MQFKLKKIITGYSAADSDEPGEDFLSSSHPQQEICYAIKGRCSFMLNNRVFEMHPGTIILIDKWVPHSFGYRKQDQDLLHLWIHIQKESFAVQLQVNEGGKYIVASSVVSVADEYRKILLRRWTALKKLSVITDAVTDEYMHSPLTGLLDEIRFQFDVCGREPLESRRDLLIEELKRHISMSNARNCSLKHLEDISGYSRFYLSRRFREYENCTIGDYIDKIRENYTAEAMKNGMLQKEIAYELGFSSPSNFWIWLNKHRDNINILLEP